MVARQAMLTELLTLTLIGWQAMLTELILTATTKSYRFEYRVHRPYEAALDIFVVVEGQFRLTKYLRDEPHSGAQAGPRRGRSTREEANPGARPVECAILG